MSMFLYLPRSLWKRRSQSTCAPAAGAARCHNGVSTVACPPRFAPCLHPANISSPSHATKSQLMHWTTTATPAHFQCKVLHDTRAPQHLHLRLNVQPGCGVGGGSGLDRLHEQPAAGVPVPRHRQHRALRRRAQGKGRCADDTDMMRLCLVGVAAGAILRLPGHSCTLAALMTVQCGGPPAMQTAQRQLHCFGSQEHLTSGVYTLVDVHCRGCATAMGWRYLSADRKVGLLSLPASA